MRLVSPTKPRTPKRASAASKAAWLTRWVRKSPRAVGIIANARMLSGDASLRRQSLGLGSPLPGAEPWVEAVAFWDVAVA